MKVENELQRLKKEFDENVNSHVFLVETNDIERAINDLKDVLAVYISPTDEIVQAQIRNETYLEMIILRSEGKTIKNEQISDLQARIKTKPVLGDQITYIIAPAEDMNDSSSNKLLKTIEEPQPNVIGFLITRNRDLLLPTIKSRCETLTLIYEENNDFETINNETTEITKAIIESFENKDHISLYKIKSSKKIDKENSLIIENLIKDYYNSACNLKTTTILDENIVEFIKSKNDYSTLIKKAKYINMLLNKLTKNMNVDLLLEKIFFDLKEVR